MFRRILTTTALLLSTLAALASTQAAAEELAGQEAIVIRALPGLQVQLRATKARFKVNQPITMSVKGNQSFFMYLFAVDAASNQAVLILPNKFQSGNKYPAQRSIRVPNATVQFLSDRPGQEKIIMVASKRYFNWNTQGYSKAGQFLVTTAKAFESQLEAFSIRPNKPKPGAKLAAPGVMVQELHVNIHGVADAPTSTTLAVSHAPAPVQAVAAPIAIKPGPAVAFISSNKPHYAPGDSINLFYGADKPGWLHLYAQAPGGEWQLLSKDASDGQRFIKKSARALSSIGEHQLLLVFSADKRGQVKINKNAKGLEAFEGLRLPGKTKVQQGVKAVLTYTIQAH